LSSPAAAIHISPAPHTLTRWFTFPVAIGFLLLLAIFFNNLEKRIIEPDIWWHLQNAHQTVNTHSLPRIDHYSFTATGSGWMDHEWLSELLYYAGFRALGLRGILAVYVACSMLIFGALYLMCGRAGANPKTASIVMVLGIIVAAVSFGPRMLLFGWLCMCALLLILQKFALTRSGPLWIIPPLFCLWINLLGSWLFGLVVLGAFIVSGLFEGQWGIIWAQRFSRTEVKKFMVVALATIAALFVNPFGYRLVWYPFDLLFRQEANINNIEEWRSVDFHDPRAKAVMVMLLGILGCGLLSRRRWWLHEVLLGAFALYASLTYWRMQFFAVLIFVPLIAARITIFPPYDPQKEKPWLNAAIIFAVIAIMLARFPSEAVLEAKIREKFPEKALAFMHDHGIQDHVLNEYAWGGYMIWHSPEIKTFIDGRADIFVYNGVFDDYLKIDRSDKTLELLDHYGIRYALLHPNDASGYVLSHSPCWRKVYSDDVAVLYGRSNEGAITCT